MTYNRCYCSAGERPLTVDGNERARRGEKSFRWGIGVAACFTLLHMIALPLTIPYDGHEYLDFSDVLFSDRFPQDWNPPIRTPGYPLVLKAAFSVLGRQPQAVVAVNTAYAWIMLLALVSSTWLLAGPAAAAAAAIVVTIFPLSVAYQHHALTESGAAAWLALVLVGLLLPDDTAARGWRKAMALGAILTAGYYHRQSMQFLVPAAAALFVLAACCRQGTPWIDGLRHPPRHWWTVAVQAAVVLIVPTVAAIFWEPFAPSRNIRAYMVKQGIVRQALVPPGDPLLGEARDAYAAAVDEAWHEDGLLSGLRARRVGELAGPLYPRLDPPVTMLGRLAFSNPERYAMGFARTLALFAGVPADQSTNLSAEHATFSPGLSSGKNRIDDGLPRLTEATRDSFTQVAAPGLLAWLLWWGSPFFDHGLVPAGFVALVGVGALGVWRRDVRLIVAAAVPMAYLLGHGAILASEDRYAFPAQPIALAALAAVVVRSAVTTFSRLRERRRGDARQSISLAFTKPDFTVSLNSIATAFSCIRHESSC